MSFVTFLFSRPRRPPTPTLFPYTTLFRSAPAGLHCRLARGPPPELARRNREVGGVLRNQPGGEADGLDVQPGLHPDVFRSEERRVGKEFRGQGSQNDARRKAYQRGRTA